MLFSQIKYQGDNFSYLLADEGTKEAAVVDTSYNAEYLIKVIEKHKLRLKYIINTHGHSDHTAGNIELKSLFGAKIVGYRLSRASVDFKVDDSDTLAIGNVIIKVIHTPGHTADSICLLIDDKKLLTGDTLFVGECGRTDLPGGSAKSLYDSLFNKLLKIDGEVEVYPGHDYGKKPCSTIKEERDTNYVLEPRSLKEFEDFMSQ